MASKGASAVLGPAGTTNPGASLPTFVVLPVPQPPPVPAYWPPWEQHLLPLMTPSLPPGQPLVLPAFPRTPLAAGDARHGPSGTGACNITLHVRSEGGRAERPQTQTLVLTPAPLNGTAPAVLCGGAACPAPSFVATSSAESAMLIPTAGGTQGVHGGRSAGLPPRVAPPAAQLAPVEPPVNAGPWPNGASREGGLATSRTKSSRGDSCNPRSVYQNFRRWQRFKALACRHVPQGPDAEALSCFLIPVLRSLSRLKPTMTLEEGMRRAVQEWQHTSNFDRMIYYEMAERFAEFEAEEEMQIQKLQGMKELPSLPPPAPPRPDPWGRPGPVVGPQPACVPGKAIPRARPARQQSHRAQRARKTKAPEEIPPEAVQEYMDIMDELLGLEHSATGEPGGEWEDDRQEPQQEDEGTYLDPGLLSYIDELCSQKDFVTKVESIIHPKFLEGLLSPDPHLDLLALAEELEQEEALTPAQAGQDDQRCDPGPQLGASDKACPPEADFKDPQGHRQADAQPSRPRASAVSSGHQESPPLRAPQAPSPPLGHSCTFSGSIPGEPRAVRETHLLVEEDDQLPSLSFLWGSPHSLLPYTLSQSPERPASALERVCSKQPAKRKCDTLDSWSKRMRQ